MAKSYLDYIDEINSQALYDGLLLEGMFGNRIIPIFTTDSFYTFINSNQMLNFSKNSNIDYIRYKSNRNNKLPRMMGIPNPFAYENLCKDLMIYWNNIQMHFSNKTNNDKYKISQVHLRKMKGTKKLFDMNYNNFKTDDTLMDELKIGKKYVVKADISNCFPSIYTHSIPWALVGKENAKQYQKDSFWFNSIDSSCRAMKMKETHGILVGPHTSNIISEIILCDIDSKLKDYTYTRHIDDYTCYCEGEKEAEQFLEVLQKELSNYDLFLNNKKTEIIKMPNIINDDWNEQLKNFSFNFYEDQIKYNSLKSFFNLVDLFVFKTNNLSIIYYAWKIINKYNLSKNAKSLYLKLSRYYLYHFPYLYPFFEKYVIEKLSLSVDDIKDIVKENIFNMMEKSNYEGVSYCLYYVYKYGIDVDDVYDNNLNKLYEDSKNTNDCIVLLLAALCVQSNKNEYKKYKNYAREILNNDEMNKYWLFCYEILTQTDLKSDWKKAKKAGVSFVKQM